MKDQGIHILALNESKIDDNYPSDLLQIDGYRFVRYDGNRDGGGVGFYVSNTVVADVRDDLPSFSLEVRCIDVKPVKGQLNKKILLTNLKENGLKCRNVKKFSFYHLPFKRYWEFYSAPPCFTTAFLVGWVLATLTPCWEPSGRPTRKKLARLFISSSQVGRFTGSSSCTIGFPRRNFQI